MMRMIRTSRKFNCEVRTELCTKFSMWHAEKHTKRAGDLAQWLRYLPGKLPVGHEFNLRYQKKKKKHQKGAHLKENNLLPTLRAQDFSWWTETAILPLKP